MQRASSTPLVLGGLALGAFLLALSFVLSDRLRTSDHLPPYSSLRSDPVGTKVLHETLVRFDSLRVRRFLLTADRLETGQDSLVLIPGADFLGKDTLERLRDLAIAGSHIVILESANTKTIDKNEAEGARRRTERERQQAERRELRDKRRKEETGRRAENGPKSDPDTEASGEPQKQTEEETEDRSALRLLGLVRKLSPAKPGATQEELAPTVAEALRHPQAPASLPESVPWFGPVRLEAEPVWQTLFEIGEDPVAVTRRMGRGRITYFTSTYPLSNEGLNQARGGQLVSFLLGGARDVVFFEHHLGVTDPQTLADLARSYGLGPAMLAALATLLLGYWRIGARLVPLPQHTRIRGESDRANATLGTLLDRSLNQDSILPALLAEAERLPPAHRPPPANIARAREALADARWEKPRPDLVTLHQRIAALLYRGRAPASQNTRPSL